MKPFLLSFQKNKFFVLIIFFCSSICSLFLYSIIISHGKEQSQNVTGYQSGITVSTYIGEGYDKAPEELRNVQGFFLGISSSHLIGEEGSNMSQPIIFHDVQKIAEISSFLSFDLIAFLDQSSLRSDALDIYQEELMNIKDDIAGRLDVLSQQINALKDAYSRISIQENNLKADVFSALDKKEATISEERLQQFISIKNKAGELYTRFQILQTIQEKYKLAQELIANKLVFVTANRNALIKGVRVVNIQDPHIQLIFSKEEWDRMR